MSVPPDPIDLGLPPMGDLDLVDLGERAGAPALEPRVAAVAKTEQVHVDIVNVAPSHQPLELDGSWKQEKDARIAGKAPLSPTAARIVAEDRAVRRHNKGLYFAVVLFLAIAGAGAYLYVLAKKESDKGAAVVEPAPTKPKTPTPGPPPVVTPARDNSVPSTGVSIRIIGANGTPITIDGAKAGKTPVSLKRGASKRAMVIGAAGSTWKIVPDHDQTIDITKP